MEVLISEVVMPSSLMRVGWEEKPLERLSRSIGKKGLLFPIGVRKVGETWELVHGARRLAACKLLGWTKISVTEIFATDELAEAIKVAENTEREDINPIDQGIYFKRLINERGWTQAKIADLIGVSAGFVSQRIGAMEWPHQLRDAVSNGVLSFSTAREIAGIRDYEQLVYITLHACKSGATPSIARQWRISSNLEQAEKERREQEEEGAQGAQVTNVSIMHCHTCGGQVPTEEISTFSTCVECRALIEAVKGEGTFKESAERARAGGGEEVEQTASEG
ncbi:MAG: ParB/RepB/Spo0J family partition protein [Dehalococcoidia bacterium]|nr:MAG: ParB/RepB/Spo0J family partition protein [Dehalococcoidia bacterium]